MGYRAHVVTQHREYGSELFCDIFAYQSYHSFLQDTFPEEMENDHVSEQEDFYEVPKSAIRAEIERLSKLPPEETNGEYDAYTNQETIDEWKCALEEAPDEDYVALEWF